MQEGGGYIFSKWSTGTTKMMAPPTCFSTGVGMCISPGSMTGGEGRDVLDAAGAAFAEDGEDVFDLLVLDAAEDGSVADAKEAAASAGNGGGVAAASEAVEKVGAVFFVDDGDD